MKTYSKIQSIYKRDMSNNGQFIIGEYSTPEIEYLKDNTWIFTEKIDGTNIRVGIQDGIVRIAGREDKSSIPTFLYDTLIKRFSTVRLISVFENEDFCLYGEGYGNKIQAVGKGYIVNTVDFILFDIRVGKWWLKREDIIDIAKQLDVAVVPVVGEGTLNDAIEMVKKDFDSTIGTAKAEGLVLRPKHGILDRGGKRIITKVKCKDFK